MTRGTRPPLTRASAVLFDLDGVLTPTAIAHERAWARTFEEVLARFGAGEYTPEDYFAHLDGKPRYAGVASLLRARGITLLTGEPTDPPELLTVCGIGNRKNAAFNAVLSEEGVKPYPGAVALLDELAAAAVPVAVVSSSKNARGVLAAAGLAGRFPVVVDGIDVAERGIPGKPAPDTFLDAARQLGADPARAAVLEDAISGVAAAKAGGFGLVIGIDRGAGPDPLTAAGADLVVDDPGRLAGGL